MNRSSVRASMIRSCKPEKPVRAVLIDGPPGHNPNSEMIKSTTTTWMDGPPDPRDVSPRGREEREESSRSLDERLLLLERDQLVLMENAHNDRARIFRCETALGMDATPEGRYHEPYAKEDDELPF